MVEGLRRVLIIEGDMGIGRMVLLTLRSAGFDPVHARTGPEALKALDETPVDAVVLDLELPDGFGSQVLDRLRHTGRQDSPALPWVVLSARDLDELTSLYGPVGDSFLSKPFDTWHLVRILRAATGQSA